MPTTPLFKGRMCFLEHPWRWWMSFSLVREVEPLDRAFRIEDDGSGNASAWASCWDWGSDKDDAMG
jgi:hypothetical protein